MIHVLSKLNTRTSKCVLPLTMIPRFLKQTCLISNIFHRSKFSRHGDQNEVPQYFTRLERHPSSIQLLIFWLGSKVKYTTLQIWYCHYVDLIRSTQQTGCGWKSHHLQNMHPLTNRNKQNKPTTVRDERANTEIRKAWQSNIILLSREPSRSKSSASGH